MICTFEIIQKSHQVYHNLHGAGCINLNGRSATNSPPIAPQLKRTRIEYETIIPQASFGF